MKRNVVLPYSIDKRAVYNFVNRLRDYEDHEFFFARPGSTVSVNAKSILGMLSAGFVKGEKIEVTVFSDDELQAFNDLWEVFMESRKDENFN